jgi:hypothetical protein
MTGKKIFATMLCIATLVVLIGATPYLAGAQIRLQTRDMDRIHTQIPGTCLQTTTTTPQTQTQLGTAITAASQSRTQTQIQTHTVSPVGNMIQQRPRTQIQPNLPKGVGGR